MRQIKCFICRNKCVKNAKTTAGTQRWICKKCNTTFSEKIVLSCIPLLEQVVCENEWNEV